MVYLVPDGVAALLGLFMALIRSSFEKPVDNAFGPVVVASQAPW